ncbi:hypothetical protein M413DRAFT_440728 [Hebeloma cylindrosporum]|uniref:DRBM domain-containing protein n=1 Tax=Hebeloma cylindrosporum TaxID=76867 RepID=A0A0C2Z231_HEBCY|nr:hypothetical protein M413DRAFT_440728 [Hebeloma cylindrosporum h7]
MSTLPPLPKIDRDGDGPDLMLDVYTHSSLRGARSTVMNDTYGDTLRLEQLGAKVLDLAVTVHLYNERPTLNTAEEIRTRSIELTSFPIIDAWLNSYGLKAKLRIAPSERDAVLNDPLEMIKFFHIYVGAAYICNNQEVVQNWISRLIDPNAVIMTSLPSAPIGPQGPPANTLSFITVALVNQTASQKGIQITFLATSEGQAHQPIWTVRCCMDGEEKGIGIGKSQKIAKEEAARQAFVAMGWGS